MIYNSHETHKMRYSDSPHYDFICDLCCITEIHETIQEPCPYSYPLVSDLDGSSLVDLIGDLRDNHIEYWTGNRWVRTESISPNMIVRKRKTQSNIYWGSFEEDYRYAFVNSAFIYISKKPISEDCEYDATCTFCIESKVLKHVLGTNPLVNRV